jgi:putative endonuclease
MRRADRAAGRAERGREAERLAARFLEARGFVILDRNHAIRQGEVDLVCRDGAVLTFVEVRSRGTAAHGSPAETVNRAKARRVVAAATHWALRHGGLERAIRFDVVAVTFRDSTGASIQGEPRIVHIRNAFDASGAPSLY